MLSLPAKTKGPVARAGDVRIPAKEELGPTPPHPEAGAARAPRAAHRPGEIDEVLVIHDVGVVSEGEDAFHGRADQDVALELVPTVIRTAVAVRTSVIVSKPEGRGWDGEAIVEGHGRILGVAQLLESDAQEAARAQESRARVAQGEEWKVGVVLDQSLGDLGITRNFCGALTFSRRF